MDSHQQELRRAATEAFFESLDKLQETLGVDGQPVPVSPQEAAPNQEDSEPEMSLASLEQAVADIEQFMQAREEK
ncbi:hypothetical protein ACKFKG_17165 [Phormidesmis sp. 146-35]